MRHGVDFFRDEIRNGFYISTAVKQTWAAHLDVLAEIDRICRKHHIKYFAEWGSLLGAVRHGGFVPWDDDLDIGMLREDYVRFRQVCDEELPKGYCIHDYERHQGHWLFLVRVVSTEHISFDEEHLLNNYNFPWLTGVDIFVKDYLYKDPELEKKRIDDILHVLAEAEPILESDPQRAISLYKKAEKRMAEVPASEADEVGQYFPWILKGCPGEKKRFFDDITYLPFEDTYIPVPYCYNELLQNRYGNYTQVKKGVAAHDYPTFEGQRKAFEKETGAKLPTYEFDGNFPEKDSSGSLKMLAKECLEGLWAFYRQTCEAKDSAALAEILGSSQQLAMDLGTMLEQARGETDPHVVPMVSALSEYCEAVFRLAEGASAGGMDEIKAALEDVEQRLQQHLFCRKQVLFLPTGLKQWQSMKNLFARECACEDTDVVVVPIPVMHKDYFGRIQATDEEILKAAAFDEFADLLGDTPAKLRSFADYDAALNYPDMIYTQDPYDAQNPLLTIPPYYYAENLCKFTDELIFVPIGPVGEYSDSDLPDMIGMNFYVTRPGPILADKILVQSENIRKHYIDKLSDFVKALPREYWENKIVADEDLYPSNDTAKTYAKKKILFGISPYEYNEKPDAFEKALRTRLDIFKDSADKVDVEIAMYPGIDDNSSFANILKALTSEYKLAVVDASTPAPYTAYYGSSIPIVQDFIACGKPVMIADYSV